MHPPQSLRLQVADSPDSADFRTVFSFTMGDPNESRESGQSDARRDPTNRMGDRIDAFTAWFDAENGAKAFAPIAGATVGNGSGTYLFNGFAAFGRYFRLYCLDNFGGLHTEVTACGVCRSHGPFSPSVAPL